MSNWWNYYNLRVEPYLSTEPLKDKNELELFWGRKEQIDKINNFLSGRSVKTILLTGLPGVGKTSLLFKLFSEEKGFVYINLSQISSILDSEIIIADAFINAISKIDDYKSREFREILENNIVETSGEARASGVSSVLKLEIQSASGRTIQKIKNLEIVSLIQKCSEYFVQKKIKIIVVLDETDFFQNSTDELISLVQRIKLKLPANSALVMANRDLNSKLSKAYKDTKSLVRVVFKKHIFLNPVWEVGQDNIEELLKLRLKKGKPKKEFIYPLTINASRVLDLLSDGNYKLLLQYLEHVLIEGNNETTKVPLEKDFVKVKIFEEYPETVVEDKQIINLLKFLNKKPTHASDPKLQKNSKVKKTSLFKRLKEMELNKLIFKEEVKTGVAQPYKLTEKGLLYIETIN